MRIKPFLLVVCACLAMLPTSTTASNSPLISATLPLELPPPPPANAGIDQNICGLTTTMAGNNPAPGTGLWTLVSGPGTAAFVNPVIRNTSVTVSVAGVYIFQWTITDGSTGLSTNDQVQVSFSNPASTSNAGPDQTVCGNQATMAGNTPTSGFGSWFSVSGPGTISFSNPSSPSCLVTASVDGTYILQWNIFNGVCPVTSDQVSVTFNSQAPAPNAGFDAVICGLTYTLNGNDPSPSTGLWTLNSGPGSATFNNAAQYNTSVTVSVPGVYLFDWTITNPVCPPEAISVQITFNFYPETCNGIDDDCDTQIDEGVLITYYVDADGDGFGDAAQFTQACSQPAGYVLDNTDCDDLNPAVYPGATEVCNLIDDDCDNQIDEGVQTTFYQDLDGDTYGNPNAATDACTQPAGYVANNLDCDDTDATIYTGAPESCNLLDDDCDTQIDEGVQNTYYADLDGDTFGDPNNTTLACTVPTGYVTDNTDCNDNNPAINPNTVWYLDADADGYYVSTLIQCTSPGAGYNTTGGISDDCNDNNPAINAGATETCNLIDDNCNGQIDEGVQNTYYQDADGDTYGNSAVTTLACTQPAGYVSDNTDCNDADATIYPGANETCNGIDDDCDTQIDEGVLITYYVDADGDGFGDATQFTQACTSPAGYVLDNTDCDDLNPAVYPGATEVCNLIDDNCDNQIDEGVQTTFYQDLDGDTYGNPNAATDACTQPAGYVANNLDCDDTDATIYTGAPESCNLLDDDCDTQIDEGVQNTYYADVDGDTFGDPNNTTLACTVPTGYVTDNTDCNDNNPAINPNTVWYLDADADGYYVSTLIQCTSPGAGYNTTGGISDDCNDNNPAINAGATETCNLIDDNCNGQIDEGVQNTYYQDADGDTYGNSAVTTLACTQPAGYVSDNTDCNDADATIYPGANETCNGIDDDCDTQIDEGVLITYYVDADGDGFGDATQFTQACTSPAGYVLDNTDCDDLNPAVYPGATEVCNLIDDNCDNQIDEGVQTTFYQDLDGDTYGNPNAATDACTQPAGYVANNLDCDDTDATIYTGAPESCNLLDDDCDTQIDEGVQNTYYADVDGDTFGDPNNTTLACTVPTGYVTDNTDCNDNNPAINPNTVWYADTDGDGFGDLDNTTLSCLQPAGYVSDNTDCNDADATIYPGANETCNGIDDDCDTQIDEGVLITYYVDADGDGFGDAAQFTQACTSPAGYVLDDTDCDDLNPAVYPGATEVCNLIDDNCDNQIDEGVQTTFYQDLDGDTYGNPNAATDACTQPAGYVANNLDCDDTDATIYTGAPESCNLLDDDCDTQIDEGVQNTYYADVDGDTFGDPNNTTLACTVPTGYVTDNTDCNDNNPAINPNTVWYLDADADGYYVSTLIQCTSPGAGYNTTGGISDDCNDNNPAINAGATETCNLIDDNCNGQIDEGVQNTYYQDADGDAYGNSAVTTLACTQPVGYVSDNTDCNDADATIYPGANETCNGIDDDCDTQIDEGVLITYYVDADGDGFGDAAQFTQACSQPAGYVLDDTDCDDLNPAVYPGATEVCNLIDDDCDNQIDEGVQTTFYQDIDGDGYGDNSNSIDACVQPVGFVLDNTDCVDNNASINPGVTEICNEIDDNCDNQIDEGVQTAYYADLDLDAFGDVLNDTLACTQPTGYVLDNTDCNDNDSAINPNTVWYLDADADGYYVSTLTQCISPGIGYNTAGGVSGDCDDTNASINAGASESCNNVDDDCSGVVDDNLVYVLYYADADGDGFGDPLVDTLSCISVTGYILDNTDCNDADASINPNTVWYEDADADGYYVNIVIQCASPGASFNTTGGTSGDCDDNNSAINAGVSEICNEIDDNCNALVDEGVQTTYYFDADLDGFGDLNTDTLACAAPIGYVVSNTDCNDNDNSINPAGVEICNGIDENCNTQIDEGVLNTYYADLDGDTFGNASNDSLACSLPIGYVTDNSDCNDNDAFYNPLTIWYLDADGDGFYIDSLTQCDQPSNDYTVVLGTLGDCNDLNSNINAAAPEICNTIDDNCDGQIDEGVTPVTYYADIDGDGFGDIFNDSLACAQPVGYTLDNTDCNDTEILINPAATEICNDIDDNCNGFADEGLTSGECADIDNDGLNGYNDIDDDNDGMLDTVELLTAMNNGDTDGDGIPDHLDLDSDNDGIFDVIENLGTDPDSDGMVGQGGIVDNNFDGLDDGLGINGTLPLDTDLDGTPNFQDLDSDADTVPDSIENDNNNDGVSLDDTDADGNYDFLDSDDDGDGLLTSVEWDYNLDGNSPDDCDYDGVPNYLDADACQLFIPEGFSPNGDGTNDTFVIENYPPASTIKIQIFNRWGSEVFASDNYLNDWTGDELPVGTYYYIIQFSTEAQGTAGYLTLWR